MSKCDIWSCLSGAIKIQYVHKHMKILLLKLLEVSMANLEGCDFCKFVNYENSDDFYLYELGTCACEPGYSYEHYVVNRCILHFVVKGKGRLVLDGHEYRVHEHQAFFIPENARAFYQADEEDPWEYVWFHIGGPRFMPIMKEAGIDYNHPIFTPLACVKEIEELAFDTMRNYQREYYCIGNIYKICDYMVANSKDKVEKNVSNSLLYVKNVISYIQLKYAEPIKIEHIAYACGLNRSYLTRLFKEATGYSLQEYLIIYRMKVASKLLTETDLTVQDIANKVGYSDAFTFTKAFKRHTGKAPSDYRRSVAKTTPDD